MAKSCQCSYSENEEYDENCCEQVSFQNHSTRVYCERLRGEKDRFLNEMNHIYSDMYEDRRVYKLRQSDFNNGPVVIRKSGIYRVVEDIVLDFNPSNDYMPPNNSNKSFSLGFFAGIIIETNNVCIDLCGHIIHMSNEFALQQRFFSIIELANTPFIPNQGPGDFGSIKSSSFVIIQNGRIGRSSHHGIRGNDASHILLRNLHILDFEIAGIALNGGHHFALNHIEIGPNFKQVPVMGNYSAARFIRQFANKAIDQLANNETAKLQVYLSALQTEMNQVLNDVKNGERVQSKLFRNPSGLPDGNNYGVLIHPRGVAINDYVDKDFDSNFTKFILIHNVTVRDIETKVNEVVGLSKIDGSGVLTDPSGSVLSINEIIDDQGLYKRNLLADVQIELGKLALRHNLTLGKLNITKEVIDWVESGENIEELLINGYYYKCNGDSMHHVAKPVHGFRLDGIKYLLIECSTVERIGNVGFMGTIFNRTNYIKPHDKQTQGAYMGCDAIGWNFSHIKYADISNVRAEEIYSSNGNAFGFRFINGSCKVNVNKFLAKQILAGLFELDDQTQTKNWYYYDINGVKRRFEFNSLYSVPNAVGLKVKDDCSVDLSKGKVIHLRAPGCEVPIWLNYIV